MKTNKEKKDRKRSRRNKLPNTPTPDKETFGEDAGLTDPFPPPAAGDTAAPQAGTEPLGMGRQQGCLPGEELPQRRSGDAGSVRAGLAGGGEGMRRSAQKRLKWRNSRRADLGAREGQEVRPGYPVPSACERLCHPEKQPRPHPPHPVQSSLSTLTPHTVHPGCMHAHAHAHRTGTGHSVRNKCSTIQDLLRQPSSEAWPWVPAPPPATWGCALGSRGRAGGAHLLGESGGGGC